METIFAGKESSQLALAVPPKKGLSNGYIRGMR